MKTYNIALVGLLAGLGLAGAPEIERCEQKHAKRDQSKN